MVYVHRLPPATQRSPAQLLLRLSPPTPYLFWRGQLELNMFFWLRSKSVTWKGILQTSGTLFFYVGNTKWKPIDVGLGVKKPMALLNLSFSQMFLEDFTLNKVLFSLHFTHSVEIHLWKMHVHVLKMKFILFLLSNFNDTLISFIFYTVVLVWRAIVVVHTPTTLHQPHQWAVLQQTCQTETTQLMNLLSLDQVPYKGIFEKSYIIETSGFHWYSNSSVA